MYSSDWCWGDIYSSKHTLSLGFFIVQGFPTFRNGYPLIGLSFRFVCRCVALSACRCFFGTASLVGYLLPLQNPSFYAFSLVYVHSIGLAYSSNF